MDVVIMNLTELKRCKKGRVTQINKHNHECRMHGVKVGAIVDVVYHYPDSVVVVIQLRETVTIPKKIAEHIIVEKI
jgi:Fe2+ transport system protein FeoA